ncbi:MAG TPA: hypothetical protein PLQ44_03350 [Candidatus Paceibacterota bacterium]|nr:hypothetical protein [Candidatus Paceibacterota bacterium]HPT40608.1 hypothetical protein [Candidatus Paceibacterota bacterium]
MKNKAIIFLILGLTLMPSFVGVQAAGGLLSGITNTCYEKGGCTFCDATKVGTNIFNFLRNKIAFPVTVLFIIYGGILMLSARGSKSQIENGRKILLAALIGFAIVFSVSLILNSVLVVLSKEKGSWQSFVNGNVKCNIESNLKTK